MITGLRSSSSGECVTNKVTYHVTYLYNWSLERCAPSDWSRIASYLAIIDSREMIIAETGCLAFWLCFRESDKRSKRKLNCEEHKKCCWVWRILIFCRCSDHNNYNKICAMLSLFAEFTTEFERSIAITLQQLFASSSVIFTSPYTNNS